MSSERNSNPDLLTVDYLEAVSPLGAFMRIRSTGVIKAEWDSIGLFHFIGLLFEFRCYIEI